MAAKSVYYQCLDTASKGVAPDKLFRTNWITMMIDRIESANLIIKNHSIDRVQPKVRETLQKYFVKEVPKPDKPTVKEKKLFVKQQGSSEGWEAVPLSETFPIVNMAHLSTNHGDVYAMNEWLNNSNQIVASVCLTAILDVCKCPTKENQVSNPDLNEKDNIKLNQVEVTVEPEPMEEQFIPEQNIVSIKKEVKEYKKHSALINLMNMSEYTENATLDHLLVYQDERTKFVQLRAVSFKDIRESATIELLQLFCDLGPPEAIIVPELLAGIFTNVLLRLNQVFTPEITISNIEESADFVSSDICLKVIKALDNWMSQSDNKNWTVGSHFIQWELNQIRGEDGKSPFERMFGRSLNQIWNQDDVPESLQGQKYVTKENEKIDDFIMKNPVVEKPSDL